MPSEGITKSGSVCINAQVRLHNCCLHATTFSRDMPILSLKYNDSFPFLARYYNIIVVTIVQYMWATSLFLELAALL